jgi:hypothetical protein
MLTAFSRHKKVLILSIGVLLVIGFGFFLSRTTKSSQQDVSPPTSGHIGGTTVTPTQAVDNSWQTFIDQKQNLTYRYPEQLPTKYIYTVNWPPQVAVINTPFSCTEGESETPLTNKTVKHTINSHAYCITTVTEGAAGSLYTRYFYVTEKDNKTIIFAFTLRVVQCGNYNEPEKSACENERQTFDIDNLMDQVIQSTQFNG